MPRYRSEDPPSGYGLKLKLREAVAYYRPLIEQVQSEEKEALDRMVNDFRIVFYFGVLEQLLRRIGLSAMFEERASYSNDDRAFRHFKDQLLESYPPHLSKSLRERINEAESARHWFAHPNSEETPPPPEQRAKASHNLGSVISDLLRQLDEWCASEEWETDLITGDASKVPELFFPYLSANTRLKFRQKKQPESPENEKK